MREKPLSKKDRKGELNYFRIAIVSLFGLIFLAVLIFLGRMVFLYLGEKKARENVQLFIQAWKSQDKDRVFKLKEKIITDGGVSLPYLIPYLGSKDDYLQAEVAYIISRFGERVIPSLVQASSSPDPSLRLGALKALETYIHRLEVVIAFEDRLTDEKFHIALYAAGVLAEQNNQRGIDFLIKTFLKGNVDQKMKALSFLVDVVNPAVVPVFYEAMKDPLYQIKIKGIEGLGKNKVEKAVPELERILNEDKYFNAREAAAIALYRITGKKYKYRTEKGDWTYPPIK